ncbi:MAG: TonB-dependent receptor [Flavobacterium sp.]|nr:MAG: TonB-dependent receptor [Flavobacterium sp.]
MKFTKLLYFCFSSILFAMSSFAQDVNVKGKIVDEVGLPMPGVTVLVKGTTNATSSDFDGNYQITAPTNSILTYSFIGYANGEEAVNGRTSINFTLKPDTEDLEEVIVVGYGTQKKSVVTGAISSVKAKDLENLPITRVEQALQGRASGVTIAANSGQPGSSATIRVRGITTFGNNEPLWVIDGVVVDAGGIGFLNQSDIESIEVLKDAASQAIYGARSAAGVILVTTKKGKSGKISVSYNGFSGFSSVARKLDLLNADQYATLINESYTNGYSGEPNDFTLPAPDAGSYGKGTDWQNLIFNKSAQRQGHDLSVSGGNDVSNFYISFGLLDQEGIVTSEISKFTRKNMRINSTHKISKWMTFGQTLSYTDTKSVGIGNTNSEFGGPLASAINMDPITKAVVTDPLLANMAPYSNQAGIFRDNMGNPYGVSTLVQQEMSNPLAYIRSRLGNYGWSNDLVGNAYLEIQPLEGLKFKTTIGAKLSNWGNYSFTPVSYFNSSFAVPVNNISQDFNRGFGWNIENTLTYTKSIGKHNFNFLLGQGTYIDGLNSGNGTTYRDIPVDDYRDAAFFDGHPAADITAYAYKTFRGSEHRVVSLFSRLNYDYDEKYLFTGIVRRDGSSNFGSNKKYGVFPSFSLGWVASKENFWIENKAINQLKIRGGYGVTGNDNIGGFRYLSTIGGGRNYAIGPDGTVIPGFSPNAPSNPDLQWEETSQTNFGFDATLFNDFNLTFDLYNKKTSGILMDVIIPGYIGATGNPVGNVADMENKGFDIELGYRKKIGEVNLSLNANVSFVQNKVTYIGTVDHLTGPTVQSGAFPITRSEVGQPFNSFYGYETNGIFQNQAEINSYTNADGGLMQPNAQPGDFRWKDINGDGTINDDDRTFIGNPLPDYTFGFSVNVEYKGFDLLVFAQGAAGNQIYQGLRRLDIGYANYQTEAMGRWVGEGTSNTYPRLTSNDTNRNFSNPSNFHLEDGDYLRFKTIQLGYSIPTKLVNTIGIQKVRLYVTGENLFTFTKYTGYDPEIGGGVLGIDRGFYPQAKSYMFGVNMQF